MKKYLKWIVIGFFLVVLTACSGDEGKLLVGATNEPHAVILEKAKPVLAEQGIDLEVKTFSKYELINPALDDKSLDANYFQHIPYFHDEVANNDYDFAIAGGIHIEPMGIYSKKYDSLDDLPDGATFIMSSSRPDHGRILSLLEREGIITLKEGVDKVTAGIDDIAENPKNIRFEYDYAPEILATLYENNEGDVIAINSNYALDAGLNPLEDSIALENEDSPYVNIIAVRKGDENKEEIQALVKVLQSEEIQQFILEEWGGSVVPVSVPGE